MSNSWQSFLSTRQLAIITHGQNILETSVTAIRRLYRRNFSRSTRTIQSVDDDLSSIKGFINTVSNNIPIAEATFNHYNSIFASPSSTKYHNVFSMTPRRTFLTRFWPSSPSPQELEKLYANAERHPLDTKAQFALYYAALKINDPDLVISRFENTKYGRNADCVLLYLRALQTTNQLERATKYFMKPPNAQNNDTSLNTNPSTSSPLSSSQSTPILNFGTKEKPLYVYSTNTGDKSWGKRLMSALNFLLVAGILYSIFNVNEHRLGGISTRVHKMFKRDLSGKGPRTYTFDDVQGCDEAKHELQEVVDFLKNPEKYNKLGAKMPKGVLLVGPPGTGKTLLAKAVAGEADVPFIYAAGSEFDELFVGIGSMRIRQMFETAKQQAPAIVFIDEIDAVGSKRSTRDPQHSRMSLNQLLIEMDGFAESQGIVVIAATNFPETLDKALLRPGRFDRHVQVPLPDVRGRTQILEMYLHDVRTASDVDVSLIARATPGFSGADLFKMVNQSKIMASLENGTHLTMRHLEQSRDEMLMGTERKSAIITNEERKLTAYHEGGHAIVALHTLGANPIHKATIIPRGRALGMVAQIPEKDELSFTKEQLLARMDVAMGGRIAEETIFGHNHITTGASSDFTAATQIARAMITQYGMGDAMGNMVVSDEEWEILSPETRHKIDNEIQALLEASKQRAQSIIQRYRTELDRIAAALLEYETLTKDEILLVVQGKRIPFTPTSVPIVNIS